MAKAPMKKAMKKVKAVEKKELKADKAKLKKKVMRKMK